MFTKVLSKLMTETDKPEDAIEFIRANIGDSLNDKDTIVSLNQKLEDANQLIEELRTKLRQYEPMDGVETTTETNVPETVAEVPVVETTASPASVPPSPAAAPVADEPMQVDTTAEKAPEVTATVAEESNPAPATTTTEEEVKKLAEGDPEVKAAEVTEPAAPAKTETEKEAPSTETPAPAVEAEKPAESAAPVAAVDPPPATPETATDAAPSPAKPEGEN